MGAMWQCVGFEGELERLKGMEECTMLSYETVTHKNKTRRTMLDLHYNLRVKDQLFGVSEDMKLNE